MISSGVVQIRGSGTGTNPSVICQPLRSPESPYAKFGPGSSSTLPAKLGPRLFNQNRFFRGGVENVGPKFHIDSSEHRGDALNLNQTDSSKNRDVYHDESAQQFPDLNAHQPRHLQRPRSATITQDHFIGPIINPASTLRHHHLHQIHETSTTTTDNINQPLDHDQLMHGAGPGTRSSSEEANSDHSNGGYFSEDSSQSITDLYGSPLELKVQIRQCSDEGILRKNLSQDNLLRSDYISRPNENCKYGTWLAQSCLKTPQLESNPNQCLMLSHLPFHRFTPTRKRGVQIPTTLHTRPENGHQTTWGRCNRREAAQTDSEVSGQYIGELGRSSMRNAGVSG